MQARPYQLEALLNIFHALHNRASALCVMPTGTGKGFVIGESVRFNPFNGRVIVIVHREEIVNQLAKHIERSTGEMPEIEMAHRRALSSNDHRRSACVVASIQTICKEKRLNKFDPHDFGMVIFDESHRSSAKSYRRVLQHFKKNSAIKVLGFTATPNRTDRITLGCIYDCVAFNYPIVTAIEQGYLVPIDQQYVYIDGLDLNSVRTTAGDLNRQEMDKIISRDEIMMGIVDATIRIAQKRKTLLFATSVYASDTAAQIFNGHEPDSAVSLSQRSKSEERKASLEYYRNGNFSRLCNCNLFTEGWDEPSIQVVSLARKTKSSLVYGQMVGRGLRPFPAGVIDDPRVVDAEDRRNAIALSPKPYCTILDFYGNSSRHKLVSTPDILAGAWPDDIIAKVKESIVNKSAMGDVTDVTEEIIQQVEEEEKRKAQKRSKLIASAKFTSTFVDPFEVSDTPQTYEPPQIRGNPPTEKMVKRLAAWGIDCEREKINYHQASKLIEEMINRHTRGMATYRQCKWLTSKSIDARNWTVERAATAIELFTENKVPALPDMGEKNWSVGMLDKGGATLFLNNHELGQKLRLSRNFSNVKEAQEYIAAIVRETPNEQVIAKGDN